MRPGIGPSTSFDSYAEMPTCRVLIIDDNPEDRDVIRRYLRLNRDTRYTLMEAETGAQGVAACRGEALPDCVILDMCLPDMDGLEVLEQLRDADGNLAVPVIVLTGCDTPVQEGRAALAAGAQDYLGKSWITAEGVARAVANAIERFHLTRELIADMAERRRAEEALRQSEDRFRRASDAAAALVYDVDLDGARGTIVNGLKSVTGYDPGDIELTSEWWHSLIHPDDLDDHFAGLTQAIITSGRWRDSYRIRHRDGAWRFVEDTAEVIVDQSGRPSCLIGTVVNITDQVQAMEKLRQSAAQLQEADQRKDEFLATLAHELRNPLAPIRNAVALLKKPNLSQEHFAFARDITESQLDIMVRLIDDLLDVSRISRGKIELKKERVTLKSIIDQAIETSKPHIEEMGHALSVELPEQEIWLDADRVRLAQVFGNLLNNAAKYSEKGGRIAITAKVMSGEWRVASPEPPTLATNHSPLVTIRVKDTGIGISPEHLPRLFEMFSQVESALTRSKGGLGIGLSLVKGLVELHGGTIEAKSDGVGKGSEFVVKLPVAEIVASKKEVARGGWRVASEEKEVLSSEFRVSSSSPNPKPETRNPELISSAPDRKRILVVDDNVTQAKTLAMLLDAMGFEARPVYNGKLALELVKDFAPQVALIDIGLPDMTGYELAGRLRKLNGNVTLIAQTGWGRDEDLERAKLAGFDHHLTKPIKHELLESILRHGEEE